MDGFQELLGDDGDGSSRKLEVEIEVDPSDECDCPAAQVARDGGEVGEVRARPVDGVCTSDVVYETDGGTGAVNVTREVDEHCFCPAIEAFDMIPEIVSVEEGHVRLSTYVSDRDDMKKALAELDDVVDSAALKKIVSVEDGERNCVDLDDLTEKQAETLRRAVSRGYYADPPGTSLDELAEEFEVSKSAISQRIGRAEAKIVTEAL